MNGLPILLTEQRGERRQKSCRFSMTSLSLMLWIYERRIWGFRHFQQQSEFSRLVLIQKQVLQDTRWKKQHAIISPCKKPWYTDMGVENFKGCVRDVLTLRPVELKISNASKFGSLIKYIMVCCGLYIAKAVISNWKGQSKHMGHFIRTPKRSLQPQ